MSNPGARHTQLPGGDQARDGKGIDLATITNSIKIGPDGLRWASWREYQGLKSISPVSYASMRTRYNIVPTANVHGCSETASQVVSKWRFLEDNLCPAETSVSGFIAHG